MAFPACIINGTAVTKTFQILYRNEEVRLEDVVNFKMHAIVEAGKVSKIYPTVHTVSMIERSLSKVNFIYKFQYCDICSMVDHTTFLTVCFTVCMYTYYKLCIFRIMVSIS